MVSSILRAAGYRVGQYTSPHLHHITERISTVAGTPLAPQKLEWMLQHHRPALEELRKLPGSCPSHFEVLTALALRHFADEAVDVAVVETGMGGLTDATNVFPAANILASVITPIGMEHVEALGGSLETIAAAKAGIMRPGRPVVLAGQPHEAARKVLVSAAQQLSCDVLVAQDCVWVEHRGYQLGHSSSQAAQELVSISIQPPPPSPPTPLPPLSLQLIGPHQHTNIQTAVAACLTLRNQGWSIPNSAIVEGLQTAQLPGRFQVVSINSGQAGEGTAASSVARSEEEAAGGSAAGSTTSSTGSSTASTGAPPAGFSAEYVVLDGAHTAESGTALVTTLRDVFPKHPLVLVVAMAADKDHPAVLAALRGLRPNVVIFTSAPIAGSPHRSAPPGTLAAQWQVAALRDRGKPFRCRELIQASLTAAFEKARHEMRGFQQRGVICFTGSLHAVAAAQKLLT